MLIATCHSGKRWSIFHGAWHLFKTCLSSCKEMKQVLELSHAHVLNALISATRKDRSGSPCHLSAAGYPFPSNPSCHRLTLSAQHWALVLLWHSASQRCASTPARSIQPALNSVWSGLWRSLTFPTTRFAFFYFPNRIIINRPASSALSSSLSPLPYSANVC